MYAAVLCCFGVSLSIYHEMVLSLDQTKLIFVEDRDCVIDPILEQDSRVTIYKIESPLQIEKIAMLIANEALFLPLTIIDERGSCFFSFFKQALETTHMAMNLRLSDAADFGVGVLRHAQMNLEQDHRSIMDLKNAFQGIPAILVGGGPSLEKNGHLLELFQSKAILFAGGKGIEKIPCKPHFAAILDKDCPLSFAPYPDIPLCFQARMHPDNRHLFCGEKILVPDSHFPFLNALSGGFDLFDSGWTVGNFMVSLALYFGCNPIICVGMEYCYRGQKKYAFGEDHSLENVTCATDCLGHPVWTQKDWLMAISWMKDLRLKHPHISFLNATEGGMEYFPFQELPLLQLPDIPFLEETIRKEILKTSLRKEDVSGSWKMSLLNQDDLIYNSLLNPFWKIWEPVFARSFDPGSLSFREKMEIHQMLFFQQIVSEHLNALH
jgi:hypothetical protein